MTEAACPMCGQPSVWEFDAGACGYCRMGVSASAPYYLVTGDTRRAVLCSPQCVRGYVAISRARGVGVVASTNEGSHEGDGGGESR